MKGRMDGCWYKVAALLSLTSYTVLLIYIYIVTLSYLRGNLVAGSVLPSTDISAWKNGRNVVFR